VLAVYIIIPANNHYHGNVCLFVCFYFVIVGKKLIEREKKIYKMTGPMAQ